MARTLDLVPACQAFVAVARQESFTVGAASIAVSQPVVSRRVAALERALGGALLERSSRRVSLTRYGRTMLPVAEQVVAAVQALHDGAARHREGALLLALPDGPEIVEIAYLASRALARGVAVETRPGDPDGRRRALAGDLVDLAVVTAPADVARWTSPLGVAARGGAAGPFHLTELRRGRRDRTAVTLWGTAEDDVAHIRDPLERARDAHGLALGQVRWTSTVVAVQRAIGTSDLVLTTAADAARFALHWRPMVDPALRRGHDLLAGADRRHAADLLAPLIGELLHPPDDTAGAPDAD
ncbi:LysR family transcriptional regulator [Allonocardiopsis opalescens]|uniref:DNA-binding transcriptional LysR family regulator n=1 Tax=Allonocardiopsis opalescens TaxID=1144618 RepID=A0A2T0QA71_9ACTN|nr:LysR family transcriptional regulator [Allonocardiopsis opalescens]PRY00720.1 DNA-binding transcriptional LysR family regulator [Allonocardiopsis opalescens]